MNVDHFTDDKARNRALSLKGGALACLGLALLLAKRVMSVRVAQGGAAWPTIVCLVIAILLFAWSKRIELAVARAELAKNPGRPQ